VNDKRIKANSVEETSPDFMIMVNDTAKIRAAMSSNALTPGRLLPTLDCEIPLTDIDGRVVKIRAVIQFADATSWLNTMKALATLPLPFLFPDDAEIDPAMMEEHLRSYEESKRDSGLDASN
jgi:hypothetical protein